jgi:hypothetical protein
MNESRNDAAPGFRITITDRKDEWSPASGEALTPTQCAPSADALMPTQCIPVGPSADAAIATQRTPAGL